LLQRIIDQYLDLCFRHRGIFLLELPLKDRTGGRDVPFSGLPEALTGLLIQGVAFLDRSVAG